ncbi:CUB and peptidase domain-containing protein 2-like isoform X1 [Pollicipes pollicipes]|uniref:CUB and peptidase domain-containing protein 2-like isoform X1 n=1 Tax=Pollicipes pollicipes TaxID=41117 RepID=UPI001884BA12|nr:CUB and peptidase domain-containing protein 2-like isoform X1 [Pollicipes pollicipes]
MAAFLVIVLLGAAAAKPPPSLLRRPPPSVHDAKSLEPVPFDHGLEVARTSLSCGDHALAVGTYTITSPNHPSNYGNNYDCAYNLTPGSGAGSLSITCSAFNIESHSSCAWDWLRVNGNKFCGTQGPSVSDSASLTIDFHADYSVVKTGYSCTITAASAPPSDSLSCGDHALAVGTYTITSPNHPSNYGNNYDCAYNLTPGSGAASLSITCSAFNIESHSSCAWDWLRVNGNKFCGTQGPSVSNSASLAIDFHADYSVVKTGYSCTITAASGSGATTQAPSGSCSCGVANRASRVVGGVETEVNEYPWQAGLVSPGGTRTWCGGSLINDRYVVTAAHCTSGSTASQIQVLLGDHRISVVDGESRHTVSQIIDHPSYVTHSQGYDISLLKLSSPVAFNSRRATVCLPTAGQTYAGATAIATGFGRLGASQPQATELQEVELPVRSEAECRTSWSFVTGTMICAGGLPAGGKSVCMGDSGGPLVTLENNKYALIGVVSFGRPCAVANTPDVFARVTAVLSWIQSSTTDATYCS